MSLKKTRRIGGGEFGVLNCKGPFHIVNLAYSKYNSPLNTSGTYQQGQKFTIKYQRNIQGPTGPFRPTPIRPQDLMNNKNHAANIFFFSFWGANPVLEAPHDLSTDEYGFSYNGSGDEQHLHGPGYYQAEVQIHKCVPDGNYVLELVGMVTNLDLP